MGFFCLSRRCCQLDVSTPRESPWDAKGSRILVVLGAGDLDTRTPGWSREPRGLGKLLIRQIFRWAASAAFSSCSLTYLKAVRSGTWPAPRTDCCSPPPGPVFPWTSVGTIRSAHRSFRVQGDVFLLAKRKGIRQELSACMMDRGAGPRRASPPLGCKMLLLPLLLRVLTIRGMNPSGSKLHINLYHEAGLQLRHIYTYAHTYPRAKLTFYFLSLQCSLCLSLSLAIPGPGHGLRTRKQVINTQYLPTRSIGIEHTEHLRTARSRRIGELTVSTYVRSTEVVHPAGPSS